MRCLINDLAASRRRSILDFRQLLGFCKGFQTAYLNQRQPEKRFQAA
ncbi:hypothetical protein [Kingella sp. (in: b-proteobacteria)]|nr:hypothetical protein [Kingella sp. (in: b-proteobacteria)]MDO4657958.1 hypothetical protein [Kingella sp. (in: b-proteobacteria)]